VRTFVRYRQRREAVVKMTAALAGGVLAGGNRVETALQETSVTQRVQQLLVLRTAISISEQRNGRSSLTDEDDAATLAFYR
jgi:hypothetical protein